MPQVGQHPVPENDTALASAISSLTSTLAKSDSYLAKYIGQAVDTVDTIIYEHFSQELPITAQEITVKVPAQTRQLERIESLYCAIVFPQSGAGPTITVDNAWAKIGDEYVNLNAIMNSSGGTGGSLGHLGMLINEGASRTFYVHATGNFPINTYITAMLFGRAIPATLGGAQV